MTTSTFNPAKAEKQELNLWLIEQPCPKFHGVGYHCKCQGSGYAFPWASEVCPGVPVIHDVAPGRGGYHAVIEHPERCKCNGTGRVPKDVGLEVLMEHFPVEVIEALRLEYYRQQNKGQEARWLLAALRAVVGSLMR